MGISSIKASFPAEPGARVIFARHRRMLTSSGAVLIFLALWQIAADNAWVASQYTSRPSQIVSAAGEVLTSAAFYHDAWISLSEFLMGFTLAIAVAVPLGFVLGTSKRLNQFLYPPLMALYMAPTLALLPILIVWIGIGAESKVAVVFLSAIFPIIVNTTAGIRETDDRLIRVACAFNATRLDIFWKIIVPGSLPAILTGVRLGVGRGVLGVIVGEMYVSQAGLGYELMSYGEAMRVNRLFVYALVVSLFGYTLTVLVRMLEDRVGNWRTS